MNETSAQLAFMAGILAFLILSYLIRWLVFRPKGSRRELTSHAEVVSRYVDQGKGGGGFTRWNYKVVFDLGSTQLDQYVTKTDYARLKEGLTGQLTWQYENLLSFLPDGS